MFAIDGPTASILLPSGRFALIHSPVSRPPGTPPEPARNVGVGVGFTACQDGTAILIPTPRTTAMRVARASGGRSADNPGNVPRTTVRAASTAMIGAIGRRYW